MEQYGQYCPVSRAVELLGDRWTLLVVRDLLLGARHFNDLERGLPGISRSLLSDRLRRLERAGVLTRTPLAQGGRVAYGLTAAGLALWPVIEALLVWGAHWSFGDPNPEELDPLLLLWWMRRRVRRELLPRERRLVQFDFAGCRGGSAARYWLMVSAADVSICLTPPSAQVDLWVEAQLGIFYQVWLGRLEYAEAVAAGGIALLGAPGLARAFPTWFAWSEAAEAVRAARRVGRGHRLPPAELPMALPAELPAALPAEAAGSSQAR